MMNSSDVRGASIMIIPLLARALGGVRATGAIVRPLLDTLELLAAIAGSLPASSLLIATAPGRGSAGGR